ncbi:MAG: Coenzyme F420 hydrogenase/dehydrogenase, beta subunit C-terminal domain, partial [Nanoarchaeota archaeon]
MDTIDKTTDIDLCLSCGICKSICPTDAIAMEFSGGQYIPKIDYESCIDCGKCLELCPGDEVDYPEIYKFKQWDYPEDVFVGNYIESYVAYSKNEEIRKSATSGGLITNIIIKLIEENRYDKAFIVDFNPSDNTEVKLKAVDKREDIIKGAKSKYLPVSVENIINYIIKSPEDKIIVVGTSCHFQGINKFLQSEKINDDNILFLGLFCDRTLNLNLLKYFEDNYTNRDRKIASFYYRNKEDKGWPGNLKIKTDRGQEKFIDRKIRMWLKPYFTLNRCFFCIDKLNQFADISFGDCYIPGEESYLGKSNIIIRSERGKEIFDQAKDILEYKKVEIDKIVESQKISKRKDNLVFDKINAGKNINQLNLKLEDFDSVKYKEELKQKQKNIDKGKDYEKNKVFIKNKIDQK